MELFGIILNLLKKPICDNCLGRLASGQLLSGLSNKERGKVIRTFFAFLIEAGERFEIDLSNFYPFKFRDFKLRAKKKACYFCQNFFEKQLEKIVEKIVKKFGKYEFSTFLIGCKPTSQMLAREQEAFEQIGIKFVETLRDEIDREIGKLIEQRLGKRADYKEPEIIAIVDLESERINLQIKSLFVFGKYVKLVRGIPQAKWICKVCGGKGCLKCEGRGKLYPTSVQEIIEKPLIKTTKAKKTKFHAQGREDIDARCLAYRPFVLELIKPLKRKISLRRIQTKINESKWVKVKSLKFVDKHWVRRLKVERADKSYELLITFYKDIDEKRVRRLRELKTLIEQKTPLRVLHRRADKLRKRWVKRVEWEILGKRKLKLKLRAQAGLYIKELVTGDKGRTKPNVCELLGNKARKILLDVVKIHSA